MCSFTTFLKYSYKVYLTYYYSAFHLHANSEVQAKLAITFYAAVKSNCNEHLKAKTNKMDENPPITTQERDEISHLFPHGFA